MMKHELGAQPCTACRGPVFSGAAVVVCAKCGGFTHRTCWTSQKDRCALAGCGSKKSTPVAVVRLQPPGPTVEELTAAVHERFEKVFHAVMTDVRTAMAHQEDLDRLREEVRGLRALVESGATAGQEREAALRKDVESHIREAVRAVSVVETAVRNLPKPTVAQELTDVSRDLAGRTDRALADLRRELTDALREATRELAVESRRTLAAVEACRWDTAARRSPLPWDARSDDVALPAAPRRED
jgi:hypothetical protein